MNKSISKHITYDEGIFSATGTRLGIKNTPPPAFLANMQIVASTIFEPARDFFQVPIKVLSFYRCLALNTAVKGANNSQHMTGEAMDLQMSSFTNADLFNYIKTHLVFDQLIWEFGTAKEPAWVHVSFSSKKNRKQVITATKVKGVTIYKVHE